LSGAYDFPIKGFIETSFIDWKHQLSSVMFCGGCNFRCPFCHNSDLVLRHEALVEVPLSYIDDTLHRFRKWTERVVITGGEPTIHNSLFWMVERLKERRFMVKLDTNGSNPRVVRRLVREGLVDFVAMDVKGPIPRYDRWCGVDVDTAKIEETISLLMENAVDYEFRMTLVPFLHTEDDAYEVAEYLRGAKRFFVQDFIPRNTLNPAYADVKAHLPEKMQAIREQVAAIMQHAKIPDSIQRQDGLR